MMKIPFLRLGSALGAMLACAPHQACAQTLPTPTHSTVTAADDGTLRGPASFWTANAAAIAEAAAASFDDGSITIAKVDGLQTVLDLKAPLASPTFTGVLTVDGATYLDFNEGDTTLSVDDEGLRLLGVNVTLQATSHAIELRSDNGTTITGAVALPSTTSIGGTTTTSAAVGNASGLTSGTVAYARLPVGTTASTVAAGDDARISGAVQSSAVGEANGVAALDATGKVPLAQLPTIAPSVQRVDVVDSDERFTLTTDDVRLGDIVRQGASPDFLYYLVVDLSALDGDQGYAGLGGGAAADLLAPPSSFEATATSASSASLVWAYPGGGDAPTGYLIDQRLGTTGAWANIADVTFGNISTDASGLEPSTLYQWRIRAYDATRTSSSLTDSVTTPAFDLTSVAGVKHHLRADEGVTESGGAVSAWIGIGPNYAQATEGLRPTFQADPAAVVFTGATQWMGLAAAIYPGSYGTDYSALGALAYTRPNPSLANPGDIGPVSTGILGYNAGSNALSIFSQGLNVTNQEQMRAVPYSPTAETIVVASSRYEVGVDGRHHSVEAYQVRPGKKGMFFRKAVSQTGRYGGNIWWAWGGQGSSSLGPQTFEQAANVSQLHESFVAAGSTNTSETQGLVMSALRNRWIAPRMPDFVLFLGDSLTKGYDVSEAESYPYKVASEAAFEADYFNAGISGRTTTQVAAEVANYEKLVRPGKLNVAMVYLGINNLGAIGATATHDKLVELCQALTTQGYTVVVATCIPYAGQGAPRNEYNVLMHTTYLDYAVALVDLAATAPFTDANIYTNPAYFQADGVHLNDAGYTVVADTVWAVLDPILNPTP